MAAASCFAVMSQVAPHEPAHADGVARTAARKHDNDASRREHDRHGRNGHGRADLVVDANGPRGRVLPGRTYKWPFEVTNRGSIPAKDVALTATPDRSLKVLAMPPKCRWRRSGQLVCKIGLLPQGETKRGTITAEVTPKARGGRPLANPVQVSWHDSATPERRTTAFPPAQVSPDNGTVGKGSAAETTDPGGPVPYPVMQTEHGPVTAEAVVVRSPVAPLAPPAPGEPCATSVVPAKVAGGKTAPVKPVVHSCAPTQNPPQPVPAAAAAANRAPGAQAVPPCGAVTAKSAAADSPVTPPCAAAQGKPDSCSCAGSPDDRPRATQDRPAAAPDRPAAAPDRPAAAQDKPAVIPDRPAVIPDKPAVVPDKPAAAPDKPAAAPSTHAAPAKTAVPGVVIVPGRPATAPSKAPAPSTTTAPSTVVVPARPAAPVGAPGTVLVPDRPGIVPCGAVAGKAVTAQDKPVILPCATAQGVPGVCGCVAAPDKQPVAVQDRPMVAPSTAAVPGRPAAEPCALHDKPVAAPCGGAVPEPAAVVPGRPGVVPCAAGADKPMAASDNGGPGRSVDPSCGSVQDKPLAAPGKVVPITPLAGPGKAAHQQVRRPASRPGWMPSRRDHAEALGHRTPHSLGRGRDHCLTQGTGFICPLGSAPRGRPHALKLSAHARPAVRPGRLRCAGGNAAACHTRMARPVVQRDNLTVRRLPTTGTSSALLALCGLGLAGAGMVLYRFGRARRSEEG